MLGIVGAFPLSWRTSVTVLRGGGRDAKGNPQPATEIPVEGCLIGPRATTEPTEFSDIVDSTAVLYRSADDGFSFLPTDRIVVPEGSRMSGEWSVDGVPSEWPMGVEVGLKR